MSAAQLKTESLAERLADVVGARHVRTDAETRAFYSQDIFSHGAHDAAIIVSPGSTAEVARIVAEAARAGAPIIARGAGMSYTGGYLPATPGAVMIDMARMNRILDISAENMLATVEAGCTWAALYDALKAKSLRTPFYGPLSGLTSTIGAGLSQHNAFLGAAANGASAESVVALKIVLADGGVLETARHFRHYGPDLTGIFLGDTGAFGVKAEATLRLIPYPEAEDYASFAFSTREGAIAAMSEFARKGLGAEVFGFDPSLQRVRMKRASLAADVKSLAAVVKNAKSLLGGVKEAAKIAVAGRDFVDEAEHSVHIACEGRSAAAVAADLDAARATAARAGGREIENTIPKVVRAAPFTPLNSIMGPEGERWAPVHGIVRHGDARAAWDAIDAYFASMQDRFERAGVYTGCLTTTLSTNAFLIEPVFYWRSSLAALHRATIDPQMLAKVKGFPPDPASDAVVGEARRAVIAIFQRFDAAHFQIGKTYPYQESLDPAAGALLQSLKSALDPARRVNPGSLGLN
jgi:FAD/FMN-containing dehydrogenase